MSVFITLLRFYSHYPATRYQLKTVENITALTQETAHPTISFFFLFLISIFIYLQWWRVGHLVEISLEFCTHFQLRSKQKSVEVDKKKKKKNTPPPKKTWMFSQRNGTSPGVGFNPQIEQFRCLFKNVLIREENFLLPCSHLEKQRQCWSQTQF